MMHLKIVHPQNIEEYGDDILHSSIRCLFYLVEKPEAAGLVTDKGFNVTNEG